MWNCFIAMWASLYCKLENVLQSDATLIQCGAVITKLRKHFYTVGQLRLITRWGKNIDLLQSGSVFIANLDMYYRVRQL